MTYEMSGVVTEIGETTEKNGFKKRNFVINAKEEGRQYDNLVQFTLKKDRVTLADNFRMGDRVKVAFSVDGRKWDGPNGVKYFTDITAWRVLSEQKPEPETETDAGSDELDADKLSF